MKKLIFSLLITLTLGVKSYAFPYLVQSAAVKAAQVGTQWTNFIWSMNAGSDQSFVFHTDQQGISKVVLRFGVTSSATNYPLQWESSVITLTSTGSIFQGYLSRTSLPPDRTYYAEFAGFLGTNTSGAGMSIGRGRINLQSSLFTDSNYTTQIVQQVISGSTNELDPVYLSDKSNLVLQIHNWATNAAVTNVVFTGGNGISNLNHLSFNTSPSGTISAGQIRWSSSRSSPQIQLNANVLVDWGTSVIYARSTQSGTMDKGEVVYLSGAFNDQPTIKRASNDSEASSSATLGILAESVASNSSAFVVTGGTVYNLTTTGYASGDKLYLGSNGSLQTNLPLAPLHGVFIGVVERVHANAGQIYVHVQNYQEIEELSDVSALSRTTNDMLIWNGTVWTNYSRTNLALQSSLVGYLPLAGGSMSGVIDMGGQTISNAVGISSLNREIDLDAGAFDGGVWSFTQQPIIPNYQTITGAFNAANLTNISALGLATTARVALVEGYTNRAAGSLQRTGDVVNGSFTINESSASSLATNYPLVFKHRSFTASELETKLEATTNGLQRTTTGSAAATIWDSLNSSFATGTPIYVESLFNANSNRITALEQYTNRAAAALASNIWANSDSVTNYASRVTFNATSNQLNDRVAATELYTNRAASALASSVWASADSTTNYQSRVQFASASNSLSTRINAVSNAVRGGTYGSYTNDILIGEGDAYLLGKYSRKLSLSGLDEGAASRTASIRYLPYGGIDYLYYDGGFGSEVLLMSNNNIVAARLTNELNSIYIREANLSQYGISSMSVTGPVAGAVTLVGSGISQTNTEFNFDGYLVSTSAAAEYISKTGAVFAGNVDVDENNLINVDNIDGFGRRIAFDGGTFTGAWTFAQAPTIPSFINTNNLSTIAGDGIGVVSNKLVSTNAPSNGFTINETNTTAGSASYPIVFRTRGTISAQISTGQLYAATTTSDGGQNATLYWSGSEVAIGSLAPLTATITGPSTFSRWDGGSQSQYTMTNVQAYTLGAYQADVSFSYEQWHRNELRRDGLYRQTYTRTAPAGSYSTGSTAAVFYWTNVLHTGNFNPASYVTVSAGNTNYWRITTAPSTSTAAGLYGQAAISGTNMFFYNHISNKWLRVNGTLEW